MGFLDRIGGAWAALSGVEGKAQTTDDKWMAATVTSGEMATSRWRSRDGDYALAARATQLVLTYSAMVARSCASCKMRAYAPGKSTAAKHFHRRGVKGKRANDYLRNPMMGRGPGHKAAEYADLAGDVVELVDLPALELIHNPNPMMRGMTWSHHCFMQWRLYGRRYTHVIVDGKGTPVEMWPMLSQFTKIMPSREGLIGGYVYGRDGAIETVFDPDEVYYHRLAPSPFNPYDSIGPLHSIAQEADIYSAATVSELATWENQGRPDWVFPIDPGTTEPQLKQLKAEAEKMLRGPKNRGKMLFATLGKEPRPLNFTPKEMEYLLGKADLRSVIRTACGVTEAMDELNDASLASAATSETQYARHTISPCLNQDAEEWTETLLRDYGIEPGEVWFAYDNPVPEDAEALRADIAAFVPLGIYSRNEARALKGMDPVDGGDDMIDPSAKPEPEPGDDDGGGTGGRSGAKALPASQPCACGSETCTVKTVTVAHSDPALVVGKEDDLRRVSERALAEFEKVVRRWLEGVAESILPVGDELTFTAAQMAPHVDRLADAIAPAVDLTISEGVRAGSLEARKPMVDAFRLIPNYTTDFLDNYTIRLAGGVSQTTADAIRDEIRKGMSEGETVTDIAKRVRMQLVGEAPSRASLIADTEVNRAHNYGKLAAWKAQGINGVRWKLGPGACPMCVSFLEQFGTERSIGKAFAEQGTTFTDSEGKGHTLNYETVYAPPLHPRCRCFIQPILSQGGDS